MRAKGILATAFAAGLLFLAPGIDSARADQGWGHSKGQSHAYQGHGHAYGWVGQQKFGHQRRAPQAYGKRVHGYQDGHRGNHLTLHQRKALRHWNSRFDSRRAFRHYQRYHTPQRYVWTRKHAHGFH